MEEKIKELIPIGACGTLSDLKVWVEEMKPDVIVIPNGHPITHIKEFNVVNNFAWKTFNGLPIKYINNHDQHL